MLLLFYSEDQGLLDFQAYRFKKLHGGDNVRHLIRLTTNELEVVLFNSADESEFDSVIIEHFKGNMDALNLMIDQANLENVLILMHQKPEGHIIRSVSNKDMELRRLNEKTKKGFVNDLLKEKYAGQKLPKEVIDEFKTQIIPSALVIAEVLNNVVILHNKNLLTKQVLNSLLRDLRKTPNVFDFLKVYMGTSETKWVTYINDLIIDYQSYRSFCGALTHQLLDFRRYLAVKSVVGDDSSEIAAKTKSPRFLVHIYNEITSRFNDSLVNWLDEFAIDLYFFHVSQTKFYKVDFTLLRAFLVKKKSALQKCLKTYEDYVVE